MTAFINHFVFEFRTGIRDKTLLLMNYLLPLGFYVMMGTVMVEINPGFREVLMPAMVIFAVLASTLLGIPDPLVNAREKGVYRSYKINGIPAISILVIPVLTTMLHLTIITLIISATAGSVFDGPLPVNWLNFGMVFLATAFASAGLSVLIGVASPSSRVTVLWSQAIFLPSMLIGGIMMPYDLLPEGAQMVSRLLPSSHMMNAFNVLAFGREAGFDAWGSVGVLVAGGVVAMSLAWYLFSWDNASGTRRAHPVLGFVALLPYVVGMFLI